MNLSKRSTGLIVAECSMSHYNGDPDVNDAPRVTEDNYGILSPQCLKHRTRSLIADPKSVIWDHLKDKFNLSINTHSIWESRLKGFDAKNAKEANDMARKLVREHGEEAAYKKYWDIRTFGCTALNEKDSSDTFRFTRTGCISVAPLLTILPVEIIEQTIMKSYPLSDKYAKEEQCCPAPLGMKVARHGLFVGSYTINPRDAHKTKTTEEDIELFKTLLCASLSTITSSGRSGLRIIQVLHADHDNPLCSFNEQKFIKACTPEVVNESMLDNGIPSRSIEDYILQIPEVVTEKMNGIKVVDLCQR